MSIPLAKHDFISLINKVTTLEHTCLTLEKELENLRAVVEDFIQECENMDEYEGEDVCPRE